MIVSGLLIRWEHGGRVCPWCLFGDLGVSCVASVLLVGGVCRMVSESGCRVSAVRFCPERCIGVIGGVGNVVVSACVLSAGLFWLESFPRVMVFGSKCRSSGAVVRSSLR